MKTKRSANFKTVLKKVFTFIVGLLLLTSCEKEIEFSGNDSSSKFKLSIVHGETLKNENKLVWEQLSKFKKAEGLESRNIDVEEHGFIINTYNGLEIASPDFTSYTFEIHRDQHEEGFWENYVLTVYPDESFIQYIVKYPILPEGGYDKENAEFTPIEGENLIGREGTCTDLQTELTDVECQVIYCYTPGHEDGSLIGTYQCIGDYNNPIETNCSVVTVSDTTNSCFGGGETIGDGGTSDNNGSSDSATNPYGYYSPANQVIRALDYTVSSNEAIWLYENSDQATLLNNQLPIPHTDEDKTYVDGHVELELIVSEDPRFTPIRLTYNPGKINNRDEFSYTHKGTDGIRTAYRLTNGDLIVMSTERLRLNEGDYNFSSDFTDGKYYYIKPSGTNTWAQLLIKENITNLAEELELLFQLAAQELGQFLGTYVCPIEDIKIIFTGTDFDGEPASRWLAAGMLLTEVVGVGKLFKVVKGIAKSNRAWRIVAEEGSQLVVKTAQEVFEKLNTQVDKAFFWSGKTNGYGGAERALEIAQSHQGITLEGLLELHNIKLPEYDFFDESIKEIWKQVSEELAKRASGKVRVVLGQNINPQGVWNTIELPALIDNQNVTEIIAIDPETLIETVIFTR